MSGFIQLIEFRSVEGHTILQRADHISTILETETGGKNGPKKTVFHLLLANNNRVQITGETRASIIEKMRSGVGNVVVIMELPKEPAPEPEEA